MKNWLPALVVLFGAQFASGDERIAKWESFSSGEGSAVLDCQNCPEDEYIRFFCPLFSKQVDVQIPGLVLPEGLDEGVSISVVFDVDGVMSTHPGKVGFSHMFGSLGTLSLGTDDPLFDRLKTGAAVTVSIKGDSIEIPLNGSKTAIELLLLGCE